MADFLRWMGESCNPLAARSYSPFASVPYIVLTEYRNNRENVYDYLVWTITGWKPCGQYINRFCHGRINLQQLSNFGIVSAKKITECLSRHSRYTYTYTGLKIEYSTQFGERTWMCSSFISCLNWFCALCISLSRSECDSNNLECWNIAADIGHSEWADDYQPNFIVLSDQTTSDFPVTSSSGQYSYISYRYTHISDAHYFDK